MPQVIKSAYVVIMLFVVLSLSSAYFVSSPAVHAAPGDPCTVPSSSILGIPTWYKYLEAEEDASGRCAPTVSNTRSALPIGIAILEAMLRLAGLVAVVMVFVGSYKYIISIGNPEKAKGARVTIINSLVGLVIVIVSTAVVSFIGNRLG